VTKSEGAVGSSGVEVTAFSSHWETLPMDPPSAARDVMNSSKRGNGEASRGKVFWLEARVAMEIVVHWSWLVHTEEEVLQLLRLFSEADSAAEGDCKRRGILEQTSSIEGRRQVVEEAMQLSKLSLVHITAAGTTNVL
jgi:hypothetical protein